MGGGLGQLVLTLTWAEDVSWNWGSIFPHPRSRQRKVVSQGEGTSSCLTCTLTGGLGRGGSGET